MAGGSSTAFEGKYLSGSAAGGWLVARFFRDVGTLLGRANLASVLEVGCGAGHSTRRLCAALPAGVALEACDIEEANLVRARELVSDVRFTRESIYELPRPAASVDTGVCLEVLEHLGDPEAGLRELVRVAQTCDPERVPRTPLAPLEHGPGRLSPGLGQHARASESLEPQGIPALGLDGFRRGGGSLPDSMDDRSGQEEGRARIVAAWPHACIGTAGRH